jgi:phage terminase Nu1 subunit (DNA packaging protein)
MLGFTLKSAKQRNMNDATVTAAVLAELVGVSIRTIRDLSKRGIVVRKGPGFARNASVKHYCAHLRDLATGRGGDSAIASTTVERGLLLREQRIAKQRENEIAVGKLLDADEVEAKWSTILRTVRAGMLAVPTRVAQRSPHLSVRDVSEIDKEVRAVLTEVGERGC